MPTHGPFEITIREHHQANQAFWWHPTRRPLDHHATTDERSALALGLRILRAQRHEYRSGRMCPSCARPVAYRGSHCDACFDAALATLG